MVFNDFKEAVIFKGAGTSIQIAVALSFLLFIPTVTVAKQASESNGVNSDFASAQVLLPGTLTVSGELSPVEPIETPVAFAQQTGALAPGEIVSHDFVVTPGAIITAAIDNSASGTDTTLGALDQNLNLLATNDDSSFLGTGLGSALTITGNPDGSARFLVSGFPDFNFIPDTASHTQAGEYELLLFNGDLLSTGDVDVFAFTGLPVGQTFIAETFVGDTAITPDTVLGLFDDLGNLIQTNDDGGVGLLSQLEVVVPLSGTVVLGVSGFADFGFNGAHTATGTYSLALEPVAIPEPSAIVLLAFSFVATGLRRRR